MAADKEQKESFQGDLLRPYEAETFLLNRLQDHGIDVYSGGDFESLRQRIATVLTENRYGLVVVGRHNGKPENYEQLYERVYAVKPKDAAKLPKPKKDCARIAREAPP